MFGFSDDDVTARRGKHSCFATGFVKASSQIRKELIEFVKSQKHGNRTSYLSGIRKALSLHATSGGNKAEPSEFMTIFTERHILLVCCIKFLEI